MVSEATHEAFYEGKRSEKLPLVINDVVIVKQGKKGEAHAWVTSIQSEDPVPHYLVEYEDGTEEVVALTHLHRE